MTMSNIARAAKKLTRVSYLMLGTAGLALLTGGTAQAQTSDGSTASA